MFYVRRGEIYYADLSPVKGSEQDGIRPVLILQNEIGNAHSPTTIIAIISEKKSRHPLPTHVPISGSGLKQVSTVKLEHIRTIDKSRLLNKIGCLSQQDLRKVNVALSVSFGLSENTMHY
jgi:mRNA interferase MazF